MRTLIALLFSMGWIGLLAQPLWEHSDLSAETSEYLDAVQGPTGHWVLTGSEYNCYSPLITLLDENGKALKQSHLKIGNSWYGRANHVFALSNGNFALVSWGALAHDVAGSNGFFTIIDTTLDIVYLDSVESYSTPTPSSSIYVSSGWQEGDTISALYYSYGDTLILRQYDGIQEMLIREDTFLVDKPSQWVNIRDRSLVASPWRGDTVFIAIGNKVGKYHFANPSPLETVNTDKAVLDLQITDNGLLVLSEGSLRWYSENLQLLNEYDWPYEAYSGFISRWVDSVVVGVTTPDTTTLVYRLVGDTTLKQILTVDFTDMLWINGTMQNDSTIVLMGRNWLKASAMQVDLKGNRVHEPFDIAIEDITYTSTLVDSFAWHPGVTAYEYDLEAAVKVRNRSSYVLDSFVIQYLYPSPFQVDCPVFTEGETKRVSVLPGESKIVDIDWSMVRPYHPNWMDMCFTAYAPNGTIDEPKIDNSFCLLVKITGVEEMSGALLARVWADGDNDRILIQTSGTGRHLISIFNLAGQRVIQQSLAGTFNQINYRLPTGIYTWQIHNQKGELIGSDKLMLH